MLLEWISTKISRMDIAVKFVEEHPELQGPYKPFLKYFASFFKSGDYEKAAHVAAVSPQVILLMIKLFWNNILTSIKFILGFFKMYWNIEFIHG